MLLDTIWVSNVNGACFYLRDCESHTPTASNLGFGVRNPL